LQTEPLNPLSKRAVVLVAAVATLFTAALLGRAQPQLTPAPATPPTPAINRNVILLDPAHGGPDAGATLPGPVAEKDVTLVLASILRTALTAAGFTVVSTRDNDPSAAITTDQRADIANRARPLACIVLHATAAGSGVHVFASALQPSKPAAPSSGAPGFTPTPWDEAQSPFVPQSLVLAAGLTAALARSNLPPLFGRAPLRPLDNLFCASVAIEVAPLLVPGSAPVPVDDANYQQRLASTLVAALNQFRDQTAVAAPAAPLAPRPNSSPNPKLTRPGPAAP
jgi:N-acetylmuramoyl-L-alanine amidase